MAQALSDDLRLRVLRASAAGMSARQAAARFGVGISMAIRWIARAKDGEPTSRPQGWRRPSVLDAHEAFVVELIEDSSAANPSPMSDSGIPICVVSAFDRGDLAFRMRVQVHLSSKAISEDRNLAV